MTPIRVMEEREWSREEIKKKIEEDQEKVYEFIKEKPLNELSNREIDVLVDRYVMNNRPSVNVHSKLPTSDMYPPNYSSNMNDAWKIAQTVGLALIPQSHEEGYRWYACDVEKVSYQGDTITIIPLEDTGYSHETAPMTICLSALVSVGIELGD